MFLCIVLSLVVHRVHRLHLMVCLSFVDNSISSKLTILQRAASTKCPTAEKGRTGRRDLLDCTFSFRHVLVTEYEDAGVSVCNRVLFKRSTAEGLNSS